MMAGNSGEKELLRKSLINDSERLCAKTVQSGLGTILHSFLPTLNYAFVLECVPDQAEDFYWVLINSTEIVKVEVPRGQLNAASPALLKKIDIKTYCQTRHSKEARERLEIARELIRDCPVHCP